MARIRGDRAVVEALRAEGVRHVFGLPGGHSCQILYDALYDEPGIQAVLCRHEESGAFEALGYAQATNTVGLCHGTAGPGFGQLLPGLHEAYASRTPLIALSASVPQSLYGMGALQEFPQQESALPFCKWSYTLGDVERIPWAMRRAFSIAAAPPPGPVSINIPIDIGMQEFEAPPYTPAPMVRFACDPARVSEACELLLRAESPVIVAGRGVHQAAAWDELRELAEMLAAPVLTTNSGKGAIPENHPLSAGGVGINATSVSERVYGESDCLLWAGSQLEEWATWGWRPRPQSSKLIYLDADPAQMSRSWVPDVALVGDAKIALRQILDYCTGRVEKDWKRYPRVAEIARLREEFRRDVELVAGSESPVHPAKLASVVSEVMEDDAIPILGEGINRVWTAKVLEVRTAGHWVSASDYGCMGFSVPAAIGVKLGRPGKQVFCITGDGNFQMQMHEIPVAKQYNAPVTWFIADNGTLGWIKEHQRDQMGGRYIAVDFDPAWRFDKVAEACGIEGIRVERASELREAVTRAFNLNREGMPVVVDVVTPQFPTPLKQS